MHNLIDYYLLWIAINRELFNMIMNESWIEIS